MFEWTSYTLDKILDTGDQLYLKSIQQSDNNCLLEVPPKEVFNSIYLGRKKINFLIDDQGKIVTRVPSIAEEKVRDTFVEALDTFFKRYSSGIFSLGDKNFAVWIQNDAFYLFDPTEHHENGEPWKGAPGKD